MDVSRRTAIAATAAAMVTAPALAGLPADEDPHVRLHARYQECLAEVLRLSEQFGNFTQEANAHAAYWEALKELVLTPPATMAGSLIVANVYVEDIVGAHSSDWKDDLDERAAINLRDGIARLAGAS